MSEWDYLLDDSEGISDEDFSNRTFLYVLKDPETFELLLKKVGPKLELPESSIRRWERGESYPVVGLQDLIFEELILAFEKEKADSCTIR